MIPANKLGSSVAESDGVRKDRKKYTTEKSKIQQKDLKEGNTKMKKIIAMFICMTVLVISAAVASAQMYPGVKDQKVYFDINVFCNSTTTYTRARDCERKINSVAAIFVYHDDNVMTDEYTNHFRGQEAANEDAAVWTTRGSKWCTQGLKVPIQNSNIKSGMLYTVSARGNTNYYNYDGISSVALMGHFSANSSVAP